MRIHAIGVERDAERTRMSARFELEEADLAPRQIWIDYSPGEPDVQASPESFLLLGFSLACWVGEKRVLVEGPLCPVLRENLDEAMRLLEHWYPHVRRVPIEATEGLRTMRPPEPQRTGFLMSGGVDALGTLESHMAWYPEDHPDRVREGFHLRGASGYDFDEGGEFVPWRMAEYERHAERLRELGRGVGFSLTTITTNMLSLYSIRDLTGDVAWAAAYLAPCHALSGRISDLIISSTGFGAALVPHASHPMLDLLFSTSAVRVRHPLPFLGRLEKLERIAKRPELLKVLTVCLHEDEPKPGEVNCGRCPKCVRTMLGLIALGKLGDTPTFATKDLAKADVEAVSATRERLSVYYEPLVEPLRRAGRDDLARAVEDLVRRQRARHSLRRRLSRRLRRAIRGR